MLPQRYRLSSQDIARIKKTGSRMLTHQFSCKFLPTHNKETKMAVIVGKKVAKTAVGRNRIKRKIHAAFMQMLQSHPSGSMDLILFVQKDIQETQTSDILRELTLMLKRRSGDNI